MIERKMPVTMVVRRSGIRAVFVTPVLGKKHCCLVKSLMCCSRGVGSLPFLGLVSFVRVAGQEEEHDGATAKRVPQLLVAAIRLIHIID
jgi:hypothetical protein